MRAPPSRILLVEDEADIRDSLRDLLESSLDDVRVTTAEDGEEALRVLPALAPHLVISDYKMPGMDGLELLTRVRMQAPHAHRLLMTAFPDMDVAIRAVNEARIQGFLSKPLDVGDLLRRVSHALRDQDARREEARTMARTLRVGKA